MTLHAVIQYLKYRRRAKGRHGTHSPFVYDLIDHVLQDRELINKDFIVEYPDLALRYENLISRMAAYYRYKHILLLPIENKTSNTTQIDMLVLSEKLSGNWVAWVNKYLPLCNSSGMIIAVGIHKSLLHTKEWEKLCRDPKVKAKH